MSQVHYHRKGDVHDGHHPNDEAGWYFWDEICVDHYGPYETEAIARRKLRKYCREQLGEKL